MNDAAVQVHLVDVDEDTAVENRTVNERMRAATAGVRMELVDPAKVRAARAAGRGVFPKPAPDPRAVEQHVDGPGGPVALRVIRAEQPAGAFVHIHGGGFTYGAPDEYDDLLRVIVDRMGLSVVSVDYRLAPEHPFPAAVDDCEAAVLWFLEHAADLVGAAAGAPVPMLIGGESAGANLVVSTLIRLRDRHGLRPFAGALLSYGWYDLGLTPSMRSWGDTPFVLSTPLSDWLAAGYVGTTDRDARRAAEVSPLHADLRDLPAALISVGTADQLVDDSMFLAARWWLAGNVTELDVYPDAIHGFDSLPTAYAEVAMSRYVDWALRIVAAATA